MLKNSILAATGILFFWSWPQKGATPEDSNPSPPIDIKENLDPTFDCHIRMEFGKFSTQDVRIKKNRITGSNFNIHREGNVFYGFIRNQPSRFRVTETQVTGTIAGMEIILHIKREDFQTQLSGLVGTHRVIANASLEKIIVDAGSSLVLTRTRTPNYFRGHLGHGPDISAARFKIGACKPSPSWKCREIWLCPEMIVVLFLWWLGG